MYSVPVSQLKKRVLILSLIVSHRFNAPEDIGQLKVTLKSELMRDVISITKLQTTKSLANVPLIAESFE